MLGYWLDSRHRLAIGVVIVFSIMAYRVAIGTRRTPPELLKSVSADAPIKSSPPRQAAPVANRDDVEDAGICPVNPERLTRLDSPRIDEAVRRGGEWLYGRLTGFSPDVPGVVDDRDGLLGLMLYTLMLGGRIVSGDGELTARIQALRSVPPATVRAAATRIMVLTLYEPPAPPYVEEPRFWKDIIRCAQYLVDNQGQDGSWGLGAAIDLPVVPDLKVTSHSPWTVRCGIRRRRWGAEGDATGTGWAISGLYPCTPQRSLEPVSASYVAVPFECYSGLEAWLTDAQNHDGGWGERRGDSSIGSATAVGLRGLTLCLGVKGQNVADRDIRLQKAYRWIRSNLSNRTDGSGGRMPYDQWVYCLRRAAASSRMLHDDPGDGVERALQQILEQQDADGGWGSGQNVNERTWETCRALLALRMP